MILKTNKLLEEKIDLLKRYNQNMENSLKDLEILQIENVSATNITNTYQWNKANMDIRDWEKFRQDNQVLITNLQKKKEHERKKAEA